MLYFLKNKEGSVIYLLKNEYTVGRKETDILIEDDQSVSRKHALIKKQNGKIFLTDCGAKYRTYLDNYKLEPHKETLVKSGNIIKFGVIESIYSLGSVNIVTTSSCLSSDEKRKLISHIKYLDGVCVSNWIPECTHLTVNEIKLTVKVLCSLIEGKPIVTVKYWDDVVKNLGENLPFPDPNNYKPPCTEIILNKNLTLDYKEERKTIFSNKVFVFITEDERKSMAMVIKTAGGESISWEKQQITKEDIQNSDKEYLIMQNTDNPTKIQSQSLLDLSNYMKTIGKRPIPFTELALAIVNCSCEKNCNPNFNKTAKVLTSSSSKEPSNQVEILVLETQSQQVETSQTNSQNNATIPQTFINSLSATQKFAPKANSTFAEPQPSSSWISAKRTADDLATTSEIENAPKKARNETLGHFNEKKSGEEVEDGADPPVSEDSNSQSKREQVCDSKKRKIGLVESNDETVSKQVTKKQNKQKINKPNTSLRDLFSRVGASPKNFTSGKGVTSIDGVTLDDANSRSTTFDLSSSTWLSKTDQTVQSREVSKDNVDMEMLEFMNSFRNKVVIVEKKLINTRSSLEKENTSMSSTLQKKNFKKFRKVKPMKEQTMIIPTVKVTCYPTGEESEV